MFNLFAPYIHRAQLLWWRLVQPLTVGVRILLIADNSILLVRHHYTRGWYLPGGGVKGQETLEQAIRREAYEEVGAHLQELQLFGAYANFAEGKRDYIVVFLCRNYSCSDRPTREIAEVYPFALDDVPLEVSPGTRRRIDEYRANKAPGHGLW